MDFYIIAAADEKMGIGIKNKLPWNLKADLAFFNKQTRGNGKNAVIMGRSTWESLPPVHKPLKRRINIILSRNKDFEAEGAKKASSIDEALEIAKQLNAERVFVIGGAQIYSQAINHPSCAGIYLTEVFGVFECDAFFPQIDKEKWRRARESEILMENNVKFRFVLFTKGSRG